MMMKIIQRPVFPLTSENCVSLWNNANSAGRVMLAAFSEAGLVEKKIKMMRRFFDAIIGETNALEELFHIDQPLNSISSFRHDVTNNTAWNISSVQGCIEKGAEFDDLKEKLISGFVLSPDLNLILGGFVSSYQFSWLDIVFKPISGQHVYFSDANSMELARVIFWDLINNAVKYSKQKDARIDVIAGKENDHIKIIVKDNGLGMAQEFANNLGNVANREHPEIEGTGIGWQSIKKNIETLGGRYELKTKKGEGTTVEVYLPSRIFSEKPIFSDCFKFLSKKELCIGVEALFGHKEIKPFIGYMMRDSNGRIFPFRNWLFSGGFSRAEGWQLDVSSSYIMGAMNFANRILGYQS